MTDARDAAIAARFAKACAEARRHFWALMAARGLYEKDGWRILESIRQVEGGSQLVMRPMHLHLDPPGDVECIVEIEEDSAHVDTHCTPAVKAA